MSLVVVSFSVKTCLTPSTYKGITPSSPPFPDRLLVLPETKINAHTFTCLVKFELNTYTQAAGKCWEKDEGERFFVNVGTLPSGDDLHASLYYTGALYKQLSLVSTRFYIDHLGSLCF